MIVLFELTSVALAACAAASGFAGMLLARAKTRAIASVAATVPDLLESSEEATPGLGPFRTPSPPEPSAGPAARRRPRRRPKLLRRPHC
jgi:hypothetical protein